VFCEHNSPGRNNIPYVRYLAKLDFLLKTEALEKFYNSHTPDVSKSPASLKEE